MLLELLFVHVLFLPYIYGGNDTTVHNTKNILNDTLHTVESNKTKIVLVTEGGAITDINTNFTLHSDNNTNLMDLDKELGTPKTKSVVGRKGVKPQDFVDNEQAAVNSTDTKYKGLLGIKVNNTTKQKPELPHKPPVLIYENLSGSKLDVQSVPSSKTIVSDQIPNPNSGNVKIKTVQGSQPDFIMPVVITILTVPLLIAIGCLALNRGREAWKNRHYKRMDFLLDGMYND